MRSTTLAFIIAAVAACNPAQEDTSAFGQQLLSGPAVVLPTSGFGDPTTIGTSDESGNVSWVGGAWYVPLPVSAGDVIGTVTAVVRGNAPSTAQPNGNNVLVNLISRTATGNTSRAFASSDTSGTQQTLTLAPVGGYTVQPGDEMLLAFTGLQGGAQPGPSTVPSMTGAVTVAPFVPSVPQKNITETMFNIGLAQPATFAGSDSVLTNTGGNSIVLVLGSVSTVDDYLPVHVAVGATVTGWRVWLSKETSNNVVSFRLRDSDATTFSTVLVGSIQSTPSGVLGVTQIGQSGLSIPVAAGHSFYIAARSGGHDAIGAGDRILAYAVTTAL